MHLAEGYKGSFLFQFFFFSGKHLVYDKHPGQNTHTFMYTEPIVILKTI